MRRKREQPDPTLALQAQAMDSPPPWETGDPGPPPKQYVDLDEVAPGWRVPGPPPANPVAAPEGPSLDTFISNTARNDLGYSPPPRQTPARASAAPSPSAEDIAGPAPSPLLALRGLPAGLVGFGAGLAGKGPNALAANNQRIAAMGNRYFQGQQDYQDKVAALKQKRADQARQDSILADKAKVDQARYDKDQARLDARDKRFAAQDQRAAEAAARAVEAANPDSPANVRKRELESEEADKAEGRAEKLAKYKNSLPNKGPAVIGGAFSGVAPEDVSDEEIANTLAEQFGGADKVPPAFKARARLITAIKNPRKRAEAADKLYKDAQGQTNTSADDTRQDTGQKQRTDLQEVKAYMKDAEVWDTLQGALERADNALRKNGINPDNYKGEDIPGRGPIENWLPDWAVSSAGQQVRNADLSLAAERILALSGKAINEEEAKRLRAIMAHSGGWGEREYIDALQFLKGQLRHKKERLANAYPNAAAQVDAQEGKNPPTPATAAPGPVKARQGHIRVRDPKTGQTGDYEGTADEARKEGYEPI